MPIIGKRGGYSSRGFGQFIGSSVFTATGGTISTINISGTNYKLHTFTNTGSNTFTVSGASGTVDVFLVGGGGGGGMLGGGGGGGGVIQASGIVNPGTYSLVVGSGGTGVVGWTNTGTAGGSSSAFGITCLGGGCGYYYSGSANSNNQGVANNGGYSYSVQNGATLGSMSLPVGWTGNIWAGFSGGAGDTGCCSCRGGGGGGANGNGLPYSSPGNGGAGIQVNFDGNNYYWAGGGGSDGYCSNTGGNGGIGGGGGAAGQGAVGSGGGSARNTGGLGNNGTVGDGIGGNGGANTGGGGGAGCNGSGNASYYGGTGGSGIIMVRYRI